MRRPDSATIVPLGDICEFKYGKSLPQAKRAGGPVPVFGSNGEVGRHDVAITSGPTIIIGRKGSSGEVTWSDDPCWPIDTTYFVDETATGTHLRWLYHRLRKLGLTDLNRAAAVPGLHRDDAYRKMVLLPAVDDQRRIADVLDRADGLRARRRGAMEKLESLKQAIFLEMFGLLEPGTPMVKVADSARSERGSVRTGPFGSDLLHKEFVDKGIGVLGIDNVVANEFRWGQMRYITPAKYRKLSRYTVSPGDVLISIMGTCGRCAIVPDDVGVAINTKHLCCISVDRERFLPEFLHAYFLWHPLARTYLARTTKGAIMSGLNMGIIKAMPLPLVAIDEQHEWARRSARITSTVGDQALAAERTAQLFGSLQQLAFDGTL